MGIKNFSQYLVESEKEVYFTFGRMNPPTVGHGKVFDTISKKSVETITRYSYHKYLIQKKTHFHIQIK